MPAAGTPSPAPPPDSRMAGGPLSRGLLLAAAAAIVVFLAATVSALVVREHLLNVAQANFDTRVTHVTTDVRRELVLCAQLLRGASGFVAAQLQSPDDGKPSPEAWDRYVSRLDLDDAPPCVRTLGYAEASSAAFAAAPAVPMGASAGATAEPLAQTVLMWPSRGDKGEGELGVSEATRAALMRAANSGQVAMSIRSLPRDSANETESPENQRRARVDLYLPLYRSTPPPSLVSARRAALTGFVIARLDTEYLFASIAAQEPHMTLRVWAGQPSFALYPPGMPLAEQTDSAQRFHRTDTLRFGGEAISLSYATSDPSLAASADFSSSAIVSAGFAAALVAGAAVFVFVRKRGTTLADAGLARTRSSLNEARMLAIIRSSGEAIITTDEQQRIVMFNPAAEQVFRCSAMEAIGTQIDRFIPERFRNIHRKHVERFGETGVTERKMGRQQPVLVGLRADGEEFPIEASISQINDGHGKLYTVMLRDVTERMRAEDALKASRQELRELSANLQNVREVEKTRIARELHDDLGQQLTALKMDLSSVEQSLSDVPSAPPLVLSQLGGMRRLIDSTVGSVRRIAADLRPVMLDDLGLLPAIDWLLNDFTTRYGIEIERRIEPGDTQFSRNGATTLFRIVQEALTNVARHADATRVSIALVAEGDQCLLRIADDGRGARNAQAIEGHGEKSFGLLGIRERVHILGGTVSIDTAREKGFTMTVRVPLAAIQQEEALP